MKAAFDPMNVRRYFDFPSPQPAITLLKTCHRIIYLFEARKKLGKENHSHLGLGS